ncbi:MAG: GDSL-type esterase/lipase family protein [Planctomycetota bacterium]
MRAPHLFVLSICWTLTALAQQAEPATDFLSEYRRPALDRWQKAISAFDELNASANHSGDAILFLGSSSIRRWTSIATDMSPYQTIRRGYGGAKFTDMAVFAERLIEPHRFRAVVMFVGNGVTGEPEDHTPEQIEQLARYIVEVAHDHSPGTPFFLIEITPCEKRFDAWPKIRAVNSKLREVALSTPDTYFIPTASHYLNGDGTPRPELFVDDKLHLNAEGYRLWSTLIRRRLNDVLHQRAVEEASRTPE